MRRFLALGFCAVYLAFGCVAGLAHVHPAADHHEGSRGVHLDHGHATDPHDHDRHHDRDHDHGPSHGAEGGGEPGFETRHADHHGNDAVYLSDTAARAAGMPFGASPAIVSVGLPIDPPSSPSGRYDELREQPGDPPDRSSPRDRDPPV